MRPSRQDSGGRLRKYANGVNNIQGRVTRILLRALSSNTQGLAIHYGAVAGFVELGPEAVSAGGGHMYCISLDREYFDTIY